MGIRKSGIKGGNTHKPVEEHCRLPGHSVTEVKVAIPEQRNFRGRLQGETVELNVIKKSSSTHLGLNKDNGFVSQCRS